MKHIQNNAHNEAEKSVHEKVLIEYPMPETEAERKKREKLGLPPPRFSFTVNRVKPMEES